MFFSKLELLRLLGKIDELCGHRDRFTIHLAADAWGAPIDVRNPNAMRFSLPGALIAAVDKIADPQDERAKLRKLEQSSKIESKRVFARNTLRKRDERARVLYGFGWGMLERASVEVTGCSIWEEKSFQTTMDVVARARLRVCESLNIRNREQPLGACRIDDPYMLEELDLLEKVEGAGDLGYTLKTIDELLASYDLFRRGMIQETRVPWTYRRR